MKLVELIPALQTSNSVLERSRSFAIALGKQVSVSTDTPGFVRYVTLYGRYNVIWELC